MAINAPAIVLVRPQMGENIGAAARAMLNFGLTDLRLVAPRDGWPNRAATDNSSGALDVMPPVQVFDTLAEALTDCHFVYATTARMRDMVKPTFEVKSAVDDGTQRTASGQKLAFVFGPERTGLENDDLTLCHALIHVPTNPDFSSLNLGQCVLLIAYEWMSAQSSSYGKPLTLNGSLPATQDKLEEFQRRLEQELDSKGFFREPTLKPTVSRNIRNIFARSELSEQELRTLHGVVTALLRDK
jgi:tRNA/rRNA methyltransferase